ncbi:metal-dependent hydrolase family protein [Streptomyces candidus]|uniref:Tryptophan 2-monooxygenase n=1 Tax=Streptomyces candidus TaxID=67283 RepID=A0A7X0HL87_9ACTN|nr:amidohydrolase family protein [Streptomyces candidus]MBB6439616.1 tryptophan 2-monooxygenase [Streptomyces candidus]GHH56385.1 amidohydrolase [Streptomyces candidus]
MEAHQNELLVRSSRLWDGRTAEPVARIDVRLRGAQVVEMGANLTPSPGARTVDLPGHTLLPGLIDCHVHVVDEALDTEPVAYQALSALPALHTLLMHGFTTVRDLGGADQPVNISLKRAVEQGHIVGPRMVVAPNMLSGTGGHGDKTPGLAGRYGLAVGSLADGTAAVLRAVREQVRYGADWIKVAVGGGFTSPSDRLVDVGYTQEELDVMVRAAADRGLDVAAHAFGDEAVRRAVRAGVRSIEHGCLASADTLELLAKAGAYLVPTQYAQRYFLDQMEDEEFRQGQPEGVRASYGAHASALQSGFALPANSGVTVAFGTDAGLFPHSENWREFPTLVANGFSPRQALAAATEHAADLLQRPDLGHIAPGAASDVIAVPGDPFDDISVVGGVSFVVQQGRIVRLSGRAYRT